MRIPIWCVYFNIFFVSISVNAADDPWKWSYTADKGCMPVTALKISNITMSVDSLLTYLPECRIGPFGLEEKYGILIIVCEATETISTKLFYYATSLKSCQAVPLVNKRIDQLLKERKIGKKYKVKKVGNSWPD